MLPELACLQDMMTAADRAVRYLQGLDRDAFLDKDEKQSAVFGQLVILGEAARRLSVEYRDAHPEIPWHKIIGLRNRIVHGYDEIDWSIVWEVVTQELPGLGGRLHTLIAEPESR